MIVLDEQLLRYDLEVLIGKWYPGRVCFVTDLRPASVIKDDNIPTLLRGESQCTFITINESDFWRKIVADPRYCVVCFALPLTRTQEIPERLRALLKRQEFATKARRMGCVIHVAPSGAVRYYRHDSAQMVLLHE